MLGDRNQLAYKFVETGDDKYFVELITSYESIIRYKINVMVPNKYNNDFKYIMNRVRIRIWKALKNNYDPNKSIPSTFIGTVIEKAIQGYLQRQGRYKRYINNYSDSLDKTIYESDGKEADGYNYIPSKNNIEKEVINKITYQQFINKLYNSLSDMEKKLFDIIKYYPDNGRFQYNIYNEIVAETGMTYNQIDNALYRIRSRARKISNNLGFGNDEKYDKYNYRRG